MLILRRSRSNSEILVKGTLTVHEHHAYTLVTSALKYHPDRNPGHEVEFNAKFQDIQAAHEILTDPQQKLKYDTDRLRGGYLNIYSSPTRPNGPPPRQTAANFPPPPRRTTATQNGKSSYPASGVHKPPPTSGASRYASHARAGAQSWEKAKEEAQARAEAFRPFQDMKTGPTRGNASPGRGSHWSAQPGRGGSTNMPPPPPPPPPPQMPKTQRSWDQFPNQFPDNKAGFPGMSRTQTQRRRQGFAPNTPGGDEPMAQNTSAYFNVSRGERPPASSYFDSGTPTPSSTPANKPVTSPLRHTKSHDSDIGPRSPVHGRPYQERTNTKHPGVSGERTHVAGEGLSRSSSLRNSPANSPRWEGPGPSNLGQHTFSSNRNHSSSPRLRKAQTFHVASSSSSASSSEEEMTWASRPKATPRERVHQRAKSQDFGQQSDARRAYNPQTGGAAWEQQAPHNYTHSAGRSPQGDQTAHYQYPPPPPPRNQANDGRPTVVPPGSAGDTRRAANPASGFPDDASNLYGKSHFSSSRTWSEDWGFSPGKTSGGVQAKTSLLWAYPSSLMPPSPALKKPKIVPARQDKFFPTVRSADISDKSPINPYINPKPFLKADTLPSSFDSPGGLSADSGNATKGPFGYSFGNEQKLSSKDQLLFDPQEWDGKFANSDDMFRPPPSRDRASPSKLPKSRLRPSTKARADSPDSAADAPSAVRAGSTLETTESTSQAASPAFQLPKFSADEWAEKLKDSSWPVPTNDGTGRAKTPKRSSKTSIKKPAAPKAASVAAENGSVSSGQATPADPMDIDMELDPTERVPPSSSNGAPATPPRVPAQDRRRSEADVSQPISSRTRKASHPATAADAHAPHLINDPIAVTLNGLTNVAPFTSSNSTGLADIRDIGATLPFESRPSDTVDLSTTSFDHAATKSSTASATKLDLPKPPRAPVAPTSEKLIQHSWERYIAEMSAYMYEWNIFNKRMLRHFKSRQDQMDMGLSSHWMSSIGDGPKDEGNGDVQGEGKAGYATYMGWIEQDVRVREWWDVACERHRNCVIELGKVREMIKGRKGVNGF